MIHKHHIIPRHAGGANGPTKKVTVAEHAEEHRLLWEKNRDQYDYIAWKALSGQLTMSKARRLAQKEGQLRGSVAGGRIGGRRSAASQIAKGTHCSQRGVGMFQPGMASIAGKIGGKASSAKQLAAGTHSFLHNSKEQHIRAGKSSYLTQINSGKHASQRKFRCIDHGVEMDSLNIKRWHKSCGIEEIKE